MTAELSNYKHLIELREEVENIKVRLDHSEMMNRALDLRTAIFVPKRDMDDCKRPCEIFKLNLNRDVEKFYKLIKRCEDFLDRKKWGKRGTI